MESLPAEILAHVFEQFSKCEICQKDCLRATKKWKSLFKCSDRNPIIILYKPHYENHPMGGPQSPDHATAS